MDMPTIWLHMGGESQQELGSSDMIVPPSADSMIGVCQRKSFWVTQFALTEGFAQTLVDHVVLRVRLDIVGSTQ